MTRTSADSEGLLLPASATLMLWTGACLSGRIGPDDAAALALGTDRTGVDTGGEDLYDWMTGLRRLPLARLHLVLPRPGRIAGLVGPPAAVSAAIAGGQAVVVSAADLADHTLVPSLREELGIGPDGEPGTVVMWTRHAAPPGRSVHPPSGGAREQLLSALRRAAASTLDWDLVPEEPVDPARAPSGWVQALLPGAVDAPLLPQLALASRTLLLVEDELVEGNPQAVTLAEKDLRRQMLEEMRDAAVAALQECTDRAAAELMLG